MDGIRTGIATAAILLSASFATAHHSFSPYDLERTVEVTGVLTGFSIRNPHVTLELTTADGQVTWEVESMNPRRWDNAGIPRDVASVGETVTLIGWPAHNGEPSMALGTIITERGMTVVRDRIRQGGRT